MAGLICLSGDFAEFTGNPIFPNGVMNQFPIQYDIPYSTLFAPSTPCMAPNSDDSAAIITYDSGISDYRLVFVNTAGTKTLTGGMGLVAAPKFLVYNPFDDSLLIGLANGTINKYTNGTNTLLGTLSIGSTISANPQSDFKNAPAADGSILVFDPNTNNGQFVKVDCTSLSIVTSYTNINAVTTSGGIHINGGLSVLNGYQYHGTSESVLCYNHSGFFGRNALVRYDLVNNIAVLVTGFVNDNGILGNCLLIDNDDQYAWIGTTSTGFPVGYIEKLRLSDNTVVGHFQICDGTHATILTCPNIAYPSDQSGNGPGPVTQDDNKIYVGVGNQANMGYYKVYEKATFNLVDKCVNPYAGILAIPDGSQVSCNNGTINIAISYKFGAAPNMVFAGGSSSKIVDVTQLPVEVSAEIIGNGVLVTQLACEVSISPLMQACIEGGNFQDVFGNPISDGTLSVWLNGDAKTPSGLIAAGKRTTVTLDDDGRVPAGALNLWPNAFLKLADPVPNVYWAEVNSADGQYSWRTTFFVPVTPCWDITTVIPNEFNGMGENLAPDAGINQGVKVAINITVNPSAVSMLGDSTQQFTAHVTGTRNKQVMWGVDGVAGGNGTVGTIDSTGLYSSPGGGGQHTITATSVFFPTISGNALVDVQAPVVTVSVAPSSATINTSTTQQFTATVSGSGNTAVNWYVDDIAGGNGTVGTIDSTGLYTAPSSSGNHTIKAISQADASASGTASVSVTAVAVSIFISPTTVTNLRWAATQQFTATVTGSSNIGVTWYVDSIAGGNGTVGTISVGGLYTAPSSNGSHTVTVKSNADATKTANATVSVASGITVSVGPATASINESTTQQFTATVTGTVTTTVSWYVDNVLNGNSTVGTIDSTGLYTAPAAVGSHTIKAVSTVDTSVSGTATCSVSAPITVAVTPVNPSINLGQTIQFTATVTGSTNTAVTWYVDNTPGGGAGIGTISVSGLYTAPGSAGQHTIKAVSAANGTSNGSTTITVVAVISVAISPTSASLQTAQTKQFTATVTGTTNTAVTWLVNNVVGGNSTVGTISSLGLYTAPSTVSGTQSFTVTVKSQADATVSANATVSVTQASNVIAVPEDYIVACCIGPGQGYGRFPSVGNLYVDRLWDAGMDYALTATSPFATFSTALDKWMPFFGITKTNLVSGASYTRRCIVTLGGRNAWAKYNSGGTWTSNFLTNVWTPYIDSICSTYGAGMPKDATNKIEGFEIWNEPDAGDNDGIPSGILSNCVNNWIAIASIAYPRLKAAGFHNVLGPVHQSYPTSTTGFLNTLGTLGGGQYLDIIARHHYRASPETTASDLQQEIRLVQQYPSLQGKYWYVTEANYPSKINSIVVEEFTEDKAVAYLQRLYILSWVYGRDTSGNQLLRRLFFWTYDSQNGITYNGSGEPILLCNNAKDPYYPSAPNGGENCVAKAWGSVNGSTTSGKAFLALQRNLVGCKLVSSSQSGNLYTVNIIYPNGNNGKITWDATDFTNANAIPKWS